MRRGAVSLLLAALVLCAGLFEGCGDSGSQSHRPQTSVRPPPDFVGVVSEDVFAGGPAYRSRTLAREQDAGVSLIRQTFHWKEIETRPGHFEFGRYDAYVA